MTNLTISANNMAQKFADDPEINLPAQPCFIKEVLVLPYGQHGLIFEGVRGTQVISGRGARTFIPTLIKVLDGTRNIDEIVALFPQYNGQAIINALILLYTRGLLENGNSQHAAMINDDANAFIGRYIDATRVNETRHDIYDKLTSTRIGIAATEHYADYLSQCLQDCGFADVSIIRNIEEISLDMDLVIGCFTEHSAMAKNTASVCQSKGVSLFCNYLGKQECQIGPLVVPEQSACADCAAIQVPFASSGEYTGHEFWLGIISLNAFHLISRVGPFKLYNTVRIHGENEHGKFYRKRKLSRMPGCETCGLGHVKTNQAATSIYWELHNAAHGLASKNLRNPRDHQIHYAAINVELTEKVPERIYGAHSEVLDTNLKFERTPTWAENRTVPMPRALNKSSLTTLLRYAVGYQDSDGLLRRIAPSAGGLGTTELYLCLRDIEGFENGVYRYFGIHHCIEHIGFVDDEVLAGTLGIPTHDLASVTLFGVANMLKIRQKYDRLAFRLMTLDSGVTRQITSDIADALGFNTAEYNDVRDKLAGQFLQLPMSGNARAIAFAMGLNDAQCKHANDVFMHHYYLPDMLIELTSARMLQEQNRPLAALCNTQQIKLKLHDNFGQMLLSRRSARKFQAKDIDQPTLENIARLAMLVNPEREHRGGLPLTFSLWAIVRTSENAHSHTLLKWRRDLNNFELIRSSLTSSQLKTMTIQPAFADASVNLFVTGNIHQATEAFGGRGYRELLGRAGSIMLRAQLVAHSQGVDACMWGGITEESWGQVLDIDRYTECPLFSCSLGYKNHDYL